VFVPVPPKTIGREKDTDPPESVPVKAGRVNGIMVTYLVLPPSPAYVVCAVFELNPLAGVRPVLEKYAIFSTVKAAVDIIF
jgi:hypothetical protein